MAVLVIEHDMNFIKKLCPRGIALDYGQKIAEGTYAEVRNYPKRNSKRHKAEVYFLIRLAAFQASGEAHMNLRQIGTASR
jgi:ABC-type methionine transport system ATPase subunit